jgi:hypothetical protein
MVLLWSLEDTADGVNFLCKAGELVMKPATSSLVRTPTARDGLSHYQIAVQGIEVFATFF